MLKELALVLNHCLRTKKYIGGKEGVAVLFEGFEFYQFKGSLPVTGLAGFGFTEKEARRDYAKKLRGGLLMCRRYESAGQYSEVEYPIPKTLRE